MNLTKTWPLGLLILGATLWAIPASAETDAWQDVWQEKQATATAHNAGGQLVVELGAASPEAPSRRNARRRLAPTAQRWVNPQRVARRQVIDQGSMETDSDADGIGHSDSEARRRRSKAAKPSSRARSSSRPERRSSVFGEIRPVRRRGCASCGDGGEFGGSMFDDCGPCAESPCAPCEEPAIWAGKSSTALAARCCAACRSSPAWTASRDRSIAAAMATSA